MKRLKIFLMAVMATIIFISAVFAVDILPIEDRRWSTISYTWTIATDQTSTGDSDTAIKMQFCGLKTLEIKTSGTVDITFTIKENANAAVVKTFTLTSATTKRYTTDHPMAELYVTSTITTGQVDSIKLECIAGG